MINFLHEAEDRLKRTDLDDLFKEAINCYNIVYKKLGFVSEVYPFSQKLEMKSIKINSRSKKAADALHRAKESEIKGLEILAMLIDRMR